MAAINRMMQVFEFEGDNVVACDHGSLAYTHTTLALERQYADDLANDCGVRNGEGCIMITDLETDEIINELECPL